jgi:hypothetical protein
MQNNTNHVKEMTDRYVYEVTRRLPQSQRADIEKELRGLIEDMLQDRSGEAEPGNEDIDAVLTELGKPSELAGKYKGEKRILIGPEFYDTYLTVLKIVLASVSFGLLIAFLVASFAKQTVNPFETFSTFVASEISGLIQAFGWVTIVFALAQRHNAKNVMTEKPWKPGDLPEIPSEKAIIPKSEPIAGIIFSVLGIMIFNAAPQLFGIYQLGEPAIPVFDLTQLKIMLPLINVIFCLGIVKEFFRLIWGRYSFKLAAAVISCSFVSVVLAVFVFGSAKIWNASLVSQLHSLYGFATPGIDAQRVWMDFPKFVTAVTLFGFLIDVIKTLYSSIRYGK